MANIMDLATSMRCRFFFFETPFCWGFQCMSFDVLCLDSVGLQLSLNHVIEILEYLTHF